MSVPTQPTIFNDDFIYYMTVNDDLQSTTAATNYFDDVIETSVTKTLRLLSQNQRRWLKRRLTGSTTFVSTAVTSVSDCLNVELCFFVTNKIVMSTSDGDDEAALIAAIDDGLEFTFDNLVDLPLGVVGVGSELSNVVVVTLSPSPAPTTTTKKQQVINEERSEEHLCVASQRNKTDTFA